MSQAILVRVPGLTLIVGPFSGEETADAWIAEKKKNPNGYLGIKDGSELSCEVLPLQSPDAFRRTNPAQRELFNGESPVK